MSSHVLLLQNAANANGNGTSQLVGDFDLAQIVEIAETGGGTASVSLQGSFDGTNWVSGVGYQQTNGVSALVRATGAISVTANSRNVFQVLDPYPELRAVLSSVAGGAIVTVRLLAVG